MAYMLHKFFHHPIRSRAGFILSSNTKHMLSFKNREQDFEAAEIQFGIFYELCFPCTARRRAFSDKKKFHELHSTPNTCIRISLNSVKS